MPSLRSAALDADVTSAQEHWHPPVRNLSDGTRTYFLLANDIERGIDIFSWRGPRNPIGASPSSAGLARPPGPRAWAMSLFLVSLWSCSRRLRYWDADGAHTAAWDGR